MSKIPNKINLTEKEMPKYWLNLPAVMPSKLSPGLNPATKKEITYEELCTLFSKELSRQELNASDVYIEIPKEITHYYKMYRPSPLIRAYALEKALKTPARIYFKYEGNNSSGSHKLNSALPQAYYNKKEGIKNLSTETGAGQWGSALSIACQFFNMPLTVFMVKSSFHQKPQRKTSMEMFGAKVIASPSTTTEIGRKILEDHPNTGGSLGCAISEAVEFAAKTKSTRYVLGSVMNMVLLHQTIIGMETKLQLEKVDEYPDILIGCAGGGSNLGGLIAPFIKDKIEGAGNTHIIAVESKSCPSLTRGVFAYDYGDTGMLTPLYKMYTVGHDFIPSPIHAGGLRYHGMAPIVSQLYHDKLLDEARAESQSDVFRAALLFTKTEAIIPAPESAHAIKTAIDEAIRCREEGKQKCIVFGLTGHGHLDLIAYQNHLSGSMEDYIPTSEEISRSLDSLPAVD